MKPEEAAIIHHALWGGADRVEYRGQQIPVERVDNTDQKFARVVLPDEDLVVITQNVRKPTRNTYWVLSGPSGSNRRLSWIGKKGSSGFIGKVQSWRTNGDPEKTVVFSLKNGVRPVYETPSTV